MILMSLTIRNADVIRHYPTYDSESALDSTLDLARFNTNIDATKTILNESIVDG